ncbi:MAG: hypothetical protein ACE5KK_08130 [Candidatus Brocadiales bacterium]
MGVRKHEMRLIQATLVTLFLLTGCSTEDWGVGFTRGMRSLPRRDFTSSEKEEALEAKARFEKPFKAELNRKLEENELSDLKGWLVLFRFFSDGTTKTANIWVYTYWGDEERHKVYSVPLKSFLDKSQLSTMVEGASQEVTSFLLQKAAGRYKQMVD